MYGGTVFSSDQSVQSSINITARKVDGKGQRPPVTLMVLYIGSTYDKLGQLG